MARNVIVPVNDVIVSKQLDCCRNVAFYTDVIVFSQGRNRFYKSVIVFVRNVIVFISNRNRFMSALQLELWRHR